MIETINLIADKWFTWQTAMLWQVAVLIAIVWAVDLLIRKWAWPQVRYALWLLILVKLVLSPTLTLPTSLTARIPALVEKTVKVQLTQPAAATLPVPAAPYRFEPVFDAEAPVESVPINPPILTESPMPPAVTPDTTPLTSTTIAPEPPGLSFKVYVLLAWLGGVVVLAGWLIGRLRRFRREHLENINNTNALPRKFCALLEQTAAQLKLKKIPRVVLTDKVKGPAVFGIFRPVLLMPADKVACLTSRDTEHILLHELAHIKRGDLFVHAVFMVLQIAYWFNPLVWLTRKPLQSLRELCCDATVAKILKDKTSGYRETLLETARQLLAEPATVGMGLLGLFENSHRLPDRLKWLERKTWKNRPLRIALIGVLVGVMLSCVLPMAKAQNLTHHARKVMKLANRKAHELNHAYIGTEHILLALIGNDKGVAARILKNLDIDTEDVAVEIGKLVKGGSTTVKKKRLPQTARAERVMPYAREAARSLNHDYVSNEHILLGVMRVKDGIAAKVLANLGAEYADVRRQVRKLVGPGPIKGGHPTLVISGIVKDAATGLPIAGAKVGDDGYAGGKRNTVTESDGTYSFLTWPEHHSIKAEADGYKPQRETLYKGHFDFKKETVEQVFNFELTPERATSNNSGGDPKRYQTITFKESMSIREALRFLGKAYKKNIIPSDKVDGRVPVTELYDVTFEETLQAILGPHKYIIEGDFIRVYTAQEYKNLQLTPEDASAKPDVNAESRVASAVKYAGRFKASLPNKVTVQLAAICKHPSAVNQWWLPDGTLLDNPIFTSGWWASDLDEKSYAFVVTLENATQRDNPTRPGNQVTQPDVKWTEIEGATESRIRLRVVHTPGFDLTENTSFHAVKAQFAEDAQSTAIKLQIACDPWRAQATYDGRYILGTPDPEKGINFDESYETAEGVKVVFSHKIEGVATRLVADVAGRSGRYSSARLYTIETPDGSQKTLGLFSNVKLADIKWFRLETRHYHYVTFQPVPLRPNTKIKTQPPEKNAAYDLTKPSDYIRRYLDNIKPEARNGYEVKHYEIIEEYTLKGDTGAVAYVFTTETLQRAGGLGSSNSIYFLYRWHCDEWEGIYSSDGFGSSSPQQTAAGLKRYRESSFPKYLDRIEQGYIYVSGNKKRQPPEHRMRTEQAKPPASLQAPSGASERVKYALNKIESLMTYIENAGNEDTSGLTGYFDQINEFCDNLQGKNGEAPAPGEWGELGSDKIEEVLGLLAEIENTAEGCRGLARGDLKDLLNQHWQTLKEQYDQLCSILQPNDKAEVALEPKSPVGKKTGKDASDWKELVLPDMDSSDSPAMLALDTHELVAIHLDNDQASDEKWIRQMQQTPDRFYLIYEEASNKTGFIIGTAPAVFNFGRIDGEGSIPPKPVFQFFSKTLPDTFSMTAPDGQVYEFTVLQADSKSCRLRYRLRLGVKTDVQVEGEKSVRARNLVWGEEVNGLRASVEFVPEKESYSIGERIGIRLHIQNTSDANIQIARIKGQTDPGNWVVEDSQGEQVRVMRGRWMGSRKVDRRILLPGQTTALELRPLGIVGPGGKNGLVYVSCKPGLYIASYKYYPKKRAENDWAGTLETGKRRLVIVRAEEKPTKVKLAEVDFERYFADSAAGAEALEKLWADSKKDLRDADEIIDIVRNGLRNYKGSGNILRWIGNLFIWGKDPQNKKAIELMYHASGSPSRGLYGDAIYFGLSVTKSKTPEILRALTAVAMKTDDYYSVTGRILWGCRQQKTELMACLDPYLKSEDEAVRQKSRDVKDYFTDSKAFMAKRAAEHIESVHRQYGDKLDQFKDKLLNGNSKTRLDTLNQLKSKSIMSIVDDSFLDAFAACIKDSDPGVRTLAARMMGNKFVWSGKPKNPKAIEILIPLLKDRDRETRNAAIYYGLSTVSNPDKELVAKMLATILDDREINHYGRVIWGMRRNTQACDEILKEWMQQTNDTQKAVKAYEIYEDVLGKELDKELAERFAGQKSDAHQGLAAICFKQQPVTKDQLKEQFVNCLLDNGLIGKVMDFYIIENRQTAVAMFTCANLADRNAIRKAFMEGSGFITAGYMHGKIGPTGSGWLKSLDNFRKANERNRIDLPVKSVAPVRYNNS